MPLKDFHCLHCGAPLDEMRPDGTYHCRFCDHVFKDESLQKEIQTMEFMFEGVLLQQKEEQVSNIRRNLYNASHEEYTDSRKIVTYCREMLKLLPDDFQANFYEVANDKTPIEINRFLDDIDVLENDIYALDVVNFMIKSLDSKNVQSLKGFIEKAKAFHVFSSEEYARLMTKVEDEAEKLEEGIYTTSIPRDVFIAYSSADLDKVNEIVDFLEANELTCFTAVRNLRHGRGSTENYIPALQSAIHNCKCIVFLSSENSRRLACDALRVEIPYIKDHEKKMGKIEYILNDYGPKTTTAAKRVLENFFEGLEYCRTKEDLLSRIMQYTTGIAEDEKRKAEEELERRKKEIEIQRIALEESQKRQQEEYRKRQEELVRQQQEQYQKQQEELARRQQEELERIKAELTRNTMPSVSGSGVVSFDRNKFRISGTILEQYKGNERAVEIPNGVTDIDDSAFSGSIVASVEIPNSVVYIGNNAFEKCTNLAYIIIPSTVQQIGASVFANCNKDLTIFTPLKKIPSLWNSSFNSGLSVVWGFNGSNKEAREEQQRRAYKRRQEEERLAREKAERERIEREKAEEKRRKEEKLAKDRAEKERIARVFDISGSRLVRYKGDEWEVRIPEGIETICEDAFSNARYMKKVILPKTIMSIQKGAFNGCNSLNTVSIPSLEAWCHIDFGDEYANPCKTAHSLYIGDDEIDDVTIPASIKRLKPYCFTGVDMTKVTLPNGVISIGKSAFSNCRNLEKIVIPDSVLTIGKRAFANCGNLEAVDLPKNLNEIGEEAFLNCSGLTKVNLTSNITRIGESTFSGCKELSMIMIPDTINSIKDNAFANCSDLQFVYIPSSVKEIGINVFKNCHEDMVIYTPIKTRPVLWNENWNYGHQVVWGYQGSSAKVQSEIVYILKMQKTYGQTFDFNANCTEILKYNGSGENVTIPEGIEIIGFEAFKDYKTMKSISIPNSVTSIGESAFAGCVELAKIELAKHLKTISAHAFDGCKKLDKISFSNGIESIGDFAFNDCWSLSRVSLPDSVKSIGKNVFSNCSGLLEVELSKNINKIPESAFSGCKKLMIVPDLDNVNAIGDYAFKGCDSLTNVPIPDTVNSIGVGAFMECKSLKAISLPDNLLRIENETFMGCGELDTITIPRSLTSIGNCAFKDCIHLDMSVPAQVKDCASDAFENNKKEYDVKMAELKREADKIERKKIRKEKRKSRLRLFVKVGAIAFPTITAIITVLLWFSFYFGFETLQVGTIQQILVTIGIPVSIALVVADWILVLLHLNIFQLEHAEKEGKYVDNAFEVGGSAGFGSSFLLSIALILLFWAKSNGACLTAAYVFLGIIGLITIILILCAIFMDDSDLHPICLPTYFVLLITSFVFFTSVVACWWNLVESNNGVADTTALISLLNYLQL